MKYIIFLLALCCIHCRSFNNMHQDNIKTHAFRLKPGQDLKKEIEAYVQKEHIEAGWMMTCVGSLTQTNIRFANQPAGVKANGHFEIVSLVGTLSTNGCHLHLSVSDRLGVTTGGHLLEENIVYTTAEIVIGESKRHVFARENDGLTPWKELQVREKE